MHITKDSCDTSSRRVVITGLGIVSPLGSSLEVFWERLAAAFRVTPDLGQRDCPQSGKTVYVAEFTGSIDEFGDVPPSQRKQLAKSLKLMNRETQLGVAAGWQALRNSRAPETWDPERCGIIFGAENVGLDPRDFQAGVQHCLDESHHLDLSRWGNQGIAEVAPLWLLRCLPNMPACHLAILAGLQGPNNTITQHELGMDLAVAEACRIIRGGDADLMIVGSVGTHVSGMNRLHAKWEYGAEQNLTAAGVPSDQAVPPSEGAGAIVLEELSAAERRGATIWGEVLAAVSTSVPGTNVTKSDRKPVSAMQRAIKMALQRSQLAADHLGHIHLPDAGPSRIAPHDQPKDNSVRTWSTRQFLGDAGAGSGGMELVASLMALSRGHQSAVDQLRDDDSQSSSPSNKASRAVQTGFLKVSRHGRSQASCVAVSKHVAVATE